MSLYINRISKGVRRSGADYKILLKFIIIVHHNTEFKELKFVLIHFVSVPSFEVNYVDTTEMLLN